MQRIDVNQELKSLAPTSERYLEYEQANPEDFVTDEEEIRAIIRRAVTMTLEDSIFTLNELHGHLIKNFVKLPVPEDEAYEWLENVVYDVWRTQKEMARIAGATIPTIINTEIEGSRYYGITEPVFISGDKEDDRQLEANSIENPSEASDDLLQLVTVVPQEDTVSELLEAEMPTELDIAPPSLLPSEIAVYLFEKYTSCNDVAPKFEISYIMNLFKDMELNAQAKDIRNVIKVMADLGYISSFTTGKNKNQRTWWCMDADTKIDVSADIHDGSLRDYLPDMFDTQEAVA